MGNSSSSFQLLLNAFSRKKPKKKDPSQHFQKKILQKDGLLFIDKKTHSTLIKAEQPILQIMAADKQTPSDILGSLLNDRGHFLISLTMEEKNTPIKAIIFYDIDDTLIYTHQIKKTGEINTIHPAELITELKKANDNHILIIMLTARQFDEDQISDHPASIMSILKKMNIAYFQYIIFTNNQGKSIAMNILSQYYNLPKHHLCLVDDNPDQRINCHNAGFKTIDVYSENRHQQIVSFLRNPEIPTQNRIFMKNPRTIISLLNHNIAKPINPPHAYIGFFAEAFFNACPTELISLLKKTAARNIIVEMIITHPFTSQGDRYYKKRSQELIKNTTAIHGLIYTNGNYPLDHFDYRHKKWQLTKEHFHLISATDIIHTRCQADGFKNSYRICDHKSSNHVLIPLEASIEKYPESIKVETPVDSTDAKRATKSVDIVFLNKIQTLFKTCFIFTTDAISLPLNERLIDIAKSALSAGIALFIIDKGLYEDYILAKKTSRNILKHFGAYAIIKKFFYGLAFTNGGSSYDILLSEIQRITMLPSKDITLVASPAEIMTYGDRFKFNKIAISPAYWCEVARYARLYSNQDTVATSSPAVFSTSIPAFNK